MTDVKGLRAFFALQASQAFFLWDGFLSLRSTNLSDVSWHVDGSAFAQMQREHRTKEFLPVAWACTVQGDARGAPQRKRWLHWAKSAGIYQEYWQKSNGDDLQLDSVMIAVQRKALFGSDHTVFKWRESRDVRFGNTIVKGLPPPRQGWTHWSWSEILHEHSMHRLQHQHLVKVNTCNQKQCKHNGQWDWIISDNP